MGYKCFFNDFFAYALFSSMKEGYFMALATRLERKYAPYQEN